MKKLLRVFLALFVLLSLSVIFTACSNNEPEKFTEGLTYMKNTEGTCYIVTGIGSAKESDIVIPSKYENLPIVSIGKDAFKDTLITSINIPNSVTSIGGYAFYDCTSLTSIIIPDSVTYIGRYAFEGCDKLTIYCEAENKPSGWVYDWNSSNRPVIWGYKGE